MKKMTELSPPARIFASVAQGLVMGLFLGSILLSGAAEMSWHRAWIFLIINSLCMIITSSVLALKVPELIDERRKKHTDEKTWDKPLVLGYFSMYFPLFIVCALDKRFTWSGLVPPWISLIALCLIAAGSMMGTWASLVNPHLETYVRIQRDRNHHVCTAGPYHFIRHPTYAGLALFFAAAPVALGTVWGLIPGSIAIVFLIIRTILEDKTLREELSGYQDYARAVRFRWIPGIW